MTHDELDPKDVARLRAAVAKLPDDVEPERDLWPSIRERIDAGRVQALPVRPGGAPTLPWYASPRRLAAAAVLLVALTAAATWFTMAQRARILAGSRPSTTFEFVVSYERTAAELSARLDQRVAVLDPATRAILERSLRTIDGAIADAREALAGDPHNPAVQAFVAAAYRQKIDFLQRANDVAVSLRP